MKNFYRSIGIAVMILAAGIFTAGCDNLDDSEDDTDVKDVALTVPGNITINIDGLKMTVTWDSVANAQGYEITTTSANCGSGNRVVNTKTKTVNSGSNVPAETILENSIVINLMAKMDENTAPMATSVTAKVKSLGGKVGNNNYIESNYSNAVTKQIDDTAPPIVPQNVKMSIEKKRILVIEWDAFPEADGYEILVQSIGCGSGNRIINTKAGTANPYNHTTSETTTGTNSLISAAATPTTTDELVEGEIQSNYNGRVEIISDTKIKIVLMQENVTVDSVVTPDYNQIMATDLYAKVKALNICDDPEYPDTEYSETASLKKGVDYDVK